MSITAQNQITLIDLTELYDIADIQIGSRNLIPGTRNWADSAFYINNAYGPQNGTIIDGVLTVPKNNSAVDTCFVAVDAGENYTVSIDVKSTVSAKGYTILLQYYDVNDNRKSYEYVSDSYTTDWTRSHKTFVVPKDIAKIRIGLRSAANVMSYRLLKLEKGNKPTDWTPAPEDFENQITTLTNTIAGIKSEVDANTKKITDKVWQSDISTSIKDYDNSTTQKISDRVSQVEIDIQGIHSTVSDVASTLTTKADGTTVTEISTKVSAIEQNATEIYSIVKGNNGESEIRLTENALAAIAENITLTGKVTFSNLIDDNGTTMIDGGKVYAQNLDLKGLTVKRTDSSGTEITSFEVDESGNISMNVQSLTIATSPVATSDDISTVTSQITTLGNDIESNLNTYTGEIMESISGIEDSINQLSQLQVQIGDTGILTGFGVLSQNVDTLMGINENTTNIWKKYIEIKDGQMVFGKNTDDSGNTIPKNERTTLTLSNDILYFSKNGDTVASMSEQSLDITEAHILQSLRIGNYVIQPRQSGGIAFFVA